MALAVLKGDVVAAQPLELIPKSPYVAVSVEASLLTIKSEDAEAPGL